MRTFLLNSISWMIAICIPIVLVLTGVRGLLTPNFLHIEYNLPAFPEDSYGFSKAERLYWSQISVDYLLNDAGIEFLADLRFDNDLPVFNERELDHMVDVKVLVKRALNIWYGCLVFLACLVLWWLTRRQMGFLRLGLRRGGWLTLFLLGAIILLVVFSFGIFFDTFHNVFFEPGTFMFLYSDTLIRLFPERFWRDAFLFVGIFAAAAGFCLGRIKPGE